MPCFPQLSSGATVQYPIKKRYQERTIVNTCEDGHTIKLFDPGAVSQEWQLVLQDLTDSELDALQQFFASSEGRLNSFTFMDPLNNLLMWSDALDQTVWQRSSLLQVELNIDDPIGGTNAARLLNSSATDLTLQQTVNAPGWYFYCFSLYVRSLGNATIALQLQAGTVVQNRSYNAQATWKRISLSAKANTTAGSVTVGVLIPAGQSADVFGTQLEAQPGASAYKRSFETSGVISSAHFGDDTFTYTTDGPNCHHCTVRIVTP